MKIGIKPVPITGWAVYCNEDEGSWVEHWHDRDGHVFPITLANLKTLYEEIGKVLND